MADSIQTAEMLLKDTLAIRERSIQTAETLLEETSKIRRSCEKQYRENGTAYNVFTAAGIGRKEVPMCNVLADLLDPKGRHYRGELYLDLFMKKVVIPRIEKAGKLVVSKAKVRKQSLTSEGRLIDITIDDGEVFIPIEVKINAEEEEQQLADYADFSKTKNPKDAFIPVLFLTPDGRKSEKAEPKDYVRISFEKDIIPWLEACLELPKTKKAPPVREIIKQFIRAIKSFCGIMEDEKMEKEIINLIMKKDGSFKAALSICEAVDEVKRKVWTIFEKQIFKKITEKIHDTRPEPTNKLFWCAIYLGNDIKLSVSHDLKQFYVQNSDINKPIGDEREKKVTEIMSKKTGSDSTEHDALNIWVNKNVSYRDLEDSDYNMYIYKLYKIYSDDHKQVEVADYIVSIAKELEKV